MRDRPWAGCSYIIRNDLGGSAATFGTVMAAGGLGSIAAALVLSRRGAPRKHVTFMWLAWGVGTALFVSIGLTPVSFALTGPVAEWHGARTTLGLAGAVGLLTFCILYVPEVRDPERLPLPGPRTQAISST